MDFDEHPGVPQRPPAYAHLLIDSRDRGLDLSGGLLPNANNFILYGKKNEALLYGYFTRAAITQISFDWYFPLVYAPPGAVLPGTTVAGFNNLIRVTNVTTGVSATVNIAAAGVLPFVNYNIVAAAIQAALIASPVGNGALTCVYSGTTCGFVIQTNNGDQLRFVSPLQADPSRGGLFKILTKCYRTIGVNNAAYTPAATLGLSPPRTFTSYVDILSSRLTKFQRVKDKDTDADFPRSTQIARLYLTPPGQRVLVEPGVGAAGPGAPPNTAIGPGTFPFTICVDYNTPKQIKWSPQEAMYELDLTVLDMDGDPLPWDGQFCSWEYQLTLVASET